MGGVDIGYEIKRLKMSFVRHLAKRNERSGVGRYMTGSLGIIKGQLVDPLQDGKMRLEKNGVRSGQEWRKIE